MLLTNSDGDQEFCLSRLREVVGAATPTTAPFYHTLKGGDKNGTHKTHQRLFPHRWHVCKTSICGRKRIRIRIITFDRIGNLSGNAVGNSYTSVRGCLYKAFPDKHAEDVLIVYIRNGKNIMIKIKITVNGRHFHDINAAFQEIERALEENVSRKKQEIIMKEKARRMKSSKKA